MEKRIQVNINYIRPNSSLLYSLYDKKGEQILKERTILAADRITQIKEKYGNVLYCEDTSERSIVPAYRLNIALNQAKDLMLEVSSTGKLSKTAFRGLEQVVEEITSDLFSADIEILKLMKDMKSFDEYHYFHAVNVGIMAGVFARMTGYPQKDVKQIVMGGFLLDVGYMMQDREYLEKKGNFNPDERHLVMRHPQLGYELLKTISGISPMVLQAVLFHHERFNDEGYFLMPYEKLPAPPKIAAVCDMFDSLTTSRPHRPAMDPTKAVRALLNSIGIHFDSSLIGAFINVLGTAVNNAQSFYGAGDICELNTRELALVREMGSKDMLKPKVLIFCRFEMKGGNVSVNFLKKSVEADLQEEERFVAKIVDNPEHLKIIYEKLGSRGLL